MAGRNCRVCFHAQRASIDRQLALGVPIKTISNEYGLSNGAVGRHKINCAGVVTPTKFERTEASRATVALTRLPDREQLGEMLLGLHERLDSIATRCEDEGASALSISAIDKMRLQLQDIARLQGYSGGGSDRSVNVHVGVQLSASDIASALREPMQVLDLEALREISAGE